MVKNNVLFMRFSSLGDVIIANFTAMKIKEAHPDWHLTWLVDVIYVEIVRSQPWVDEVIAWDRHSDGNSGFMKIIGEVRRNKYAILIDMHGTDRSSFFSLCSGIPVRYCEEHRFPFTHTTHDAAQFWDTTQHQAECPKYLYVATPRRSWIPEHLRNRKLLALAIGASYSKKRWPVDNWIEFCRLATDHGYNFCLLGNGADEVTAANIISTAVSPLCFVNLAGKLSLSELVQVIDSTDLTVSGDTGSLHIARALGKPLVAMFGPTSLSDTEYMKSLNNIFFCDCPKQGCGLYTCNKPCMGTIEPSVIIERIGTLI